MSSSRLFLCYCIASAIGGFVVVGFAPDPRYGYALFGLSFIAFALWAHQEEVDR